MKQGQGNKCYLAAEVGLPTSSYQEDEETVGQRAASSPLHMPTGLI